jgi:hypothetical protein
MEPEEAKTYMAYNDRMWNEVAVTHLKHCHGIYLEGQG